MSGLLLIIISSPQDVCPDHWGAIDAAWLVVGPMVTEEKRKKEKYIFELSKIYMTCTNEV